MIIMTKELFIKSIQAIKEQYEYDKKCANAFKVLLPHCHISYEGSSISVSQIILMLKVQMSDTSRDSWIEYFIHDLEFGEKYIEGCAKNMDGSIIDIATSAKLFDYLRLTCS